MVTTGPSDAGLEACGVTVADEAFCEAVVVPAGLSVNVDVLLDDLGRLDNKLCWRAALRLVLRLGVEP